MKKNMFILVFVILGGAVVFLSCNKENSNSLPEPSLIASKINAAVGEGINLNIANQPTGSFVDWTSSPSANAVITVNGFSGENARAVFTTPGTYTVTAYFHHNGDSTHHHVADTAQHHVTETASHHIADTTHHQVTDTAHHHVTDTAPHHATDTTHHHVADTAHHVTDAAHHHVADSIHHHSDVSHTNSNESDSVEKLSITITIHN